MPKVRAPLHARRQAVRLPVLAAAAAVGLYFVWVFFVSAPSLRKIGRPKSNNYAQTPTGHVPLAPVNKPRLGDIENKNMVDETLQQEKLGTSDEKAGDLNSGDAVSLGDEKTVVKDEMKPAVKDEQKSVVKEEEKPVVKDEEKSVVKDEEKPVVKEEKQAIQKEGAVNSQTQVDKSVHDDGLPDWIENYRPRVNPPEWCARLQAEPRARPPWPLFGECGRKHNEVLCADGKPSFFGWRNEDLYTWQTHFRYLKRPGVFLDVAANDPVSRSNTFFYEQCLGWSGACVEANPKYFPLLRSKRTCALVKRCVSNRVHNVTFIMHGGTGGISATNKNKNWIKADHKQVITCLPTADALRPLRLNKIDWFSLDVEGHEMFVLQGIDWVNTKIDVIVTENESPQVLAFLKERGYSVREMEKDEKGKVKPGQIWDDRLFVHSRVTWGSPV